MCFAIYGNLFSQIVHTICDVEGYQATSTNPNNAYNVNIPQIPNGNWFVNGFDWNGYTYELPNMTYNGISLSNKPGLVYLSMPSYYEYLYWESPLHEHPVSEGWEMLLSSVGYYPDSINLNPSAVFGALPYVVLYNKYKGIIRVFVGISQDLDVTNATQLLTVDLAYTQYSYDFNYLSGLLRLYEGKDKALDMPTISVKSTAVTRNATEKSRWSTVDFQVAYDPCSCNTPSNLRIDFNYLKKSYLNLYGRSVGITDPDILSNEMGANPNKFLSSFDNSIVADQNKHGLVIDKYLEVTIDQYIKRYEKYQLDLAMVQKHNQKVNQNLAILKLAKKVVVAGVVFFTAGTAAPALAALKTEAISSSVGLAAAGGYNPWQTISGTATDWLAVADDGTGGLITKYNGLVEKIDEVKFLDALAKVFGDDAETFVSKNFKHQIDPTAPEKPSNTITYTEMSFTGTIVDTLPKIGPTFILPGSFGEDRAIKTNDFNFANPNNIGSFPIYNENLGTFALLNTPNLNRSMNVKDENIRIDEFWEMKIENAYNPTSNQMQMTNVWYINSGIYQNWTNYYQFELDRDLKYKYNQVLDIDGTPSLSASWQIRSRQNNRGPFGWVNPSFIDPMYTSNVEGFNFPFDPDKYISIFGSDQFWFNNGNLPYQQYQNTNISGLFPAQYTYQTPVGWKRYDTLILITPFIPIDKFKPVIPAVGIKNEYMNAVRTKFLPGDAFYPVYEDGNWILPDIENVPHDKPTHADMSKHGTVLEDFDVKLKLKMDIDFITTRQFDSEQNNITQIFTYDTELTTLDSIDLQSNLEGSSLDFHFGVYQESLVLDNTIFNGSPVSGCIHANNHYECKAWKNVNIIGNLSTLNGQTVNITAGEIIETFPNSIITPEIVLKIEPVLNNSLPMPEATFDYVTNFCNKGTQGNYPPYLANTHPKNQISPYANNVVNPSVRTVNVEELSLIVFPNPAKNATTVQISRESIGTNVQVYDLMGRESNVAIRQNGLSFDLDLTNLTTGVYLVKVSSIEGTITKNLIVK